MHLKRNYFKKLVEKSLETCKILKISLIMREFLHEKLNFNRALCEIDGLLKICNISKRN